MEPKQAPITIAIIGGGIGGVSLAIGLLHQSNPLDVHIYEAAPQFSEIGAGVSFGPNSLRAMHLISPAIRAAFEKLKTKNHDPENQETWMNVRPGTREGGWVKEGGEAEEKWLGNDLLCKIQSSDDEKTGLSSVHRTHFLHELVKLLPAGVAHAGHRLVHLHPQPNNTIKLEFAHNATAYADAVIGADGVRSRVRQLLFSRATDTEDLVFSGKYAYRGLVEMERARSVLGSYAARNCQMHVGNGAYIFHYPIDRGRLINVIAVRGLEGGWRHKRWVLQREKEEMMGEFEGFSVMARGVLSVSRVLFIFTLPLLCTCIERNFNLLPFHPLLDFAL